LAHRLTLLVAASLSAAPVAAEGPNLLEEPFALSLGTYILGTDTEVRLDGAEDTGTPVDWEGVFGKGDVNRFRFDGTWRFADRHKLRALWFNYSRTRSGRADRVIEWGDVDFPIATELRGESRFSIFELAYEYAFMRRENFELTGTAGLHYTTLELEISGSIESPGGGGSFEASDTGRVEVPLPVFGLRGLWHVGGDFWVDASAQYFALSYENYDGSIVDLRAGVLWQPKDWVGIGLGYDLFNVNVEVENARWRGEVDWTYDGPQIFYSVSF
jgi:hypothetical protein